MSVATSTAVLIGAGVAAAGTVYAASESAKASETAASDQVAAAQNATQLQAAEFNVQQQNLAPWLKAGNTALQTLITGSQPGGQFNQNFSANAAANYANTPGYQAALEAGQQAIEQRAASQGKSLSASTYGALGQFTANAAQQGYNTYYNQQVNAEQMALGEQETLAGYGNAATNSENQLGAEMAQNIGNLDLGIGNAEASAALGVGTAAAGVGTNLSNISNNSLQQYMNSQYMNNLFGNNNNNNFVEDPSIANYDYAANNPLPQMSASDFPIMSGG